MTTNKKSKTCCGESDSAKQSTPFSENACCSPSHEARETTEASVCCGSQHKSSSASGTHAEENRLDIDFLYLDLNVCDRCQDTGSTLEEAIEEVAKVLESTGVEVVLNKTHVTSEEQAVALGFLVSPTIRLNAQDIQMNFRESLCDTCGTLCDCEGGVSCREWEYQGLWYSAPPKGLIIEAILREVYGGAGEKREAHPKVEEAPDNLKRFFSSMQSQ